MTSEDKLTSILSDTTQICTNSENLSWFLASLKVASKLMKECKYVADFRQECFHFVSDRGLFLCGRTSDEVLQLGFKYYPEVVHKDDFVLLKTIHQVILHFESYPDMSYNDLHCFVYNFRLRYGRNWLMVCQKVAPLIVDDSSFVAVCIVSDAVIETTKLYAYFDKGKVRREYSIDHNYWKKDSQFVLTPHENDILVFYKQGKTVKQIADSIGRSEQTIKNLKVELFEKLGVKNMQQAISFSENHFLI